MARKESSNTHHERGLSDLTGIGLIGLAFLLVVALLSYDPKDLPVNTSHYNEISHNWIGLIGAWLGCALFFAFGAAAYFVPLFLLAFGLSHLLQFLAYLRRRWVSALVLIFASTGLLDLYKSHFEVMQTSLNLPGAGGLCGVLANKFFKYFGQFGATIILGMLYLFSLYGLTDLRLGVWLREWWQSRRSGEQEGLAPEEIALQRRARELEKQARQLQDQLEKQREKHPDKSDEKTAEKSGLGADLKPVPEPTVRDLSVPQARPAKTVAKPGRGTEPVPPAPPEEPEPEIITAREIAAALTSDILGKPAAIKSGETVPASSEAAKDPSEQSEPVVIETPALPAKPRPTPRKPKPIRVASTPTIGNYQLPPLDFLQYPDQTVKPTESKEELMANARLMQQTLAQFDIEVALGDITKGPTITRYELHPAPGVKMEKIAALNNNIAAALKAERINILAPVPGKSSVGVEVPNLIKTKVMMRDLLESEEWIKSKARIPLALGKDVYGHPIVADLAEMPHLLIAGSTGSGKSVCINAIVASLLYRFPPDQLRFVMIDPKVVELQQYNGMPHLVVPVVNDPKKVILALRWVVNEMEKRYQIFAKVSVRNIKSFNERPKNKPPPPPEPELPLISRKEKIEANSEGFAVELDEEIVVPRDDDIVIPDKLSYIVVIIDELADLMLVAPAEVEMAIARITQMARAAGIHCIVATQRPSVDVITGVIKANIPARIAFQVAAKVDSRTILDAMGADKLLGKGDMLYLPPGSARLIRAQGVLITDQEIQSIVDYIGKQGKPSYEVEIHQQLSRPASNLDNNGGGNDEDEGLIEQCIEVIRSEQKASVSLLQRRLRLGYTRAARIMDELENRGIVGPSKGAEPRDILIDLDGTGADGGGN
ncbi:MAG: DNA translocase FtsK [Verrucomicrobiota bacterium]